MTVHRVMTGGNSLICFQEQPQNFDTEAWWLMNILKTGVRDDNLKALYTAILLALVFLIRNSDNAALVLSTRIVATHYLVHLFFSEQGTNSQRV